MTHNYFAPINFNSADDDRISSLRMGMSSSSQDPHHQATLLQPRKRHHPSTTISRSLTSSTIMWRRFPLLSLVIIVWLSFVVASDVVVDTTVCMQTLLEADTNQNGVVESNEYAQFALSLSSTATTTAVSEEVDAKEDDGGRHYYSSTSVVSPRGRASHSSPITWDDLPESLQNNFMALADERGEGIAVYEFMMVESPVALTTATQNHLNDICESTMDLWSRAASASDSTENNNNNNSVIVVSNVDEPTAREQTTTSTTTTVVDFIPTAAPTLVPSVSLSPQPGNDQIQVRQQVTAAPTPSLKTCQIYFLIADQDESGGDERLTQEEWPTFVGYISGQDIEGNTLSELPSTLQALFFDLAEDGTTPPTIDVTGYKLTTGDDTTDVILQGICSQTAQVVADTLSTPAPTTLPPATLSPTPAEPTVPGQPTPVPLPTCYSYLDAADESGNGVILRGEYINFLNFIKADMELGNTAPDFERPYSSLPTILQDNFVDLSEDTNGINIAGAQAGQVPTVTQQVLLLRVCRNTEAIINTVLSDDESPTTTPTLAPTSAPISIATDAPTVALSDAPSEAPSKTPSTFSPSAGPSALDSNSPTSFESEAPSTGSVPSASVAPTTRSSLVPSTSLSPSILETGSPTSSASPTALDSTVPSVAPSGSETPEPTPAFGVNGNFTGLVNFMISNEEDLTAASLTSGPTRNNLEKAFEQTVVIAVQEEDARGVSRSRRMHGEYNRTGQQQQQQLLLRRQLRVTFVNSTALLSNITDSPCRANIPPEFQCMIVRAEFLVEATNEIDTFDVTGDYSAAVNNAIEAGLLQQELDDVDIFSPLTIEEGENINRTTPVRPEEQGGGGGSGNDRTWVSYVIISAIIISLVVGTYFFLMFFDRITTKRQSAAGTFEEKEAKKRPRRTKQEQDGVSRASSQGSWNPFGLRRADRNPTPNTRANANDLT